MAEAAFGRAGRNDLGNMQPGQGLARCDQVERLAKRVVGTDQKVGAGQCQFVGR